jgi:hypothetical protein
MDIDAWMAEYRKICKELGISHDSDRDARDIAGSLIGEAPQPMSKLENLIRNRDVVIFGAGPSLEKDVRKIARELDVPESIIVKPPTAGLWPGQTDEGEMGITYDALDDILQRFADKRKQVASGKLVNKVKMMIDRSEHKRQGPKVCHV